MKRGGEKFHSSSSPMPKSPNKGKTKVSGVEVLGNVEGVGAAYRVVERIGASKVTPPQMKVLAACFGFPPGVQYWCPDAYTPYVSQVHKKVYFFIATFENGLHFPLHPFTKDVL